MLLDVARLRVLVAVAHAGSLAAAARAMSFTPSALSQQIAKLEREVGCRLVERGPAGVRLTEVGDILVRHGELVLGQLRDAEAAVGEAMAAEPQRLAIGTFATAAQVRRRRPTTRLSLVDLEPPNGYDLVTAGDLDLLITHRYPGVATVPTRSLVCRHLITDPLRLVVPTGAPATTESRSVALAELAGEHWISGGLGVPNRTCLHDRRRSRVHAPGHLRDR